ncbi:hypothetical protein LZ31DRAFT_82789 [Colletotrichum somersetense]|nr:hypothetical protein LZ31DRAFT_82789 [Colletotrichum somersetense]
MGLVAPKRKKRKPLTYTHIRYQMGALRSRQIGLAQHPFHPSLTSSERDTHQESQDSLSWTSSARHSTPTPLQPSHVSPTPFWLREPYRGRITKGNLCGIGRTLARCLDARKRKKAFVVLRLVFPARPPPVGQLHGRNVTDNSHRRQHKVHECDAVERPTFCARVVDSGGLTRTRRRPRPRRRRRRRH